MALQFVRADLIDDIGELKQQLAEEGCDIEHMQLPVIETVTDVQTLKLIKNILKRKNQKLQANSILDDVMFLGLKGVEKIFDGQLSLGGFKPNLKGLTKTISIKTRNQRQHFSEQLDQWCQKIGIGNNSKLMIQLVISAVKRMAINKEVSNNEDYSENLKKLSQMYNKDK